MPLTFTPGLLAGALLLPATVLSQTPAIAWAPHDTTRPLPPVVVAPGPPAVPAPPPTDAVVLFGGSDASAWRSSRGDAIGWRLTAGALEVVPGTGDILTRQGFGDCQLHVEWMTPAPPLGDGQNRGNSGVFLMGLYEVQVLDSYRNRTYADGMAGAVYGQYPPLVNASRPPGEWQSYDIVFRRPRFDAQGALVEPARLTVFHNGVLVQHHVTLTGPTAHQRRPPYAAHEDQLPVKLQDHGVRVRFRNIWIRDLEEGEPDRAPEVFRARFETGRGAFVVEARCAWAPRGVDRFYHLVHTGFFDDSRFFRVRARYIAQFGIPGDPTLAATWRDRTFPDDSARESNARGTIAYAMLTTPNTRTTQLFINLADNTALDAQGFAPIGRVVEGMAVVDSLYAGYDEGAGGGMRAGKQGRIFAEGNAHLDRDFPKLDRLIRARIIRPEEERP